MAYINHEKKALFLHNVKCGGVYVRENLMKYYGFQSFAGSIHHKYEDFFDDKSRINYNEDLDYHTIRNKGKYRYYYSHQHVDKKIFDEYFIFTFVRNPYERIYSAYCYLKRLVSGTGMTRNSKENPDYFKDFKTFINNMDNVNNISYYHAFIPQYEQFINDNNELKISYIGKQETLDDDFINILNLIGFDDIKHIDEIINDNKLNKTNISENKFLEEYNEEILLFVNERFKKDFETFGYELYNDLNDFKKYFEIIKNTETQFWNNSLKTNSKIIKKILEEVKKNKI